MFNFDEATKYNKEALDSLMKGFALATKNAQAIAAEMAEYSKKSFELQVAHVEKLMAAKSIEAAVELQTTFAKTSMDHFITEAGKISDMVEAFAKETYKPYEAQVAKAAAVVKASVEKATEAAAA